MLTWTRDEGVYGGYEYSSGDNGGTGCLGTTYRVARNCSTIAHAYMSGWSARYAPPRASLFCDVAPGLKFATARKAREACERHWAMHGANLSRKGT